MAMGVDGRRCGDPSFVSGDTFTSVSVGDAAMGFAEEAAVNVDLSFDVPD